MAADQTCVLFIGAHPDDIELCAGGTVARTSDLGWRAEALVLTGGEHGGDGPDLVAVRRDETRRALRLLGAEVSFLDGEDTALLDEAGSVLDGIIRTIRALRPSAVLTHPADDSHPDHRAAAALVARACFLAKLPGGREPPYRTPQQFAWAPVPGERYPLGWTPTFLVDVSSTMPRKLDALRLHTSQRGWLERYAAFATLEAHRLGMLAGVGEAEGFTSAGPLLLPSLPISPPEGSK